MSCPGLRLGRRNVLRTGVAGGLGLGLADLLFLRRSLGDETPVAARAQSVIHIFLPGGVAHQETFDPKPYAPLEYRGDLGVVKTKTGEHFSAGLPQLAAIADKFTVIRSMTHTDAAHERGVEHMFTGYPPSPAISYPSIGSVVSHELGPRNHLPPYVCVPDQPNPFAGSGYLSSAYAPFSLGADPARGDFRVRDLNLPSGVTPERFARRREALAAINEGYGLTSTADNVVAMNAFYECAYSLLDSVEAREAFQLAAESKEMRDRYGRNAAGQRMLMAR